LLKKIEEAGGDTSPLKMKPSIHSIDSADGAIGNMRKSKSGPGGRPSQLLDDSGHLSDSDDSQTTSEEESQTKKTLQS